MGTGSHGYECRDEAYIGNLEGVKENTGFRAGWVGAKLLEHLALTGAREFNLTITAREIGVDVRRLYQTVVYFIKRHIVAKVRRGWYRILVDPWELLQRIVVQGPNAWKAREGVREGGVKENHGTRSVVRVTAMSAVGLFFDNVRGYTVAGGYIRGDRGEGGGRGRVISREGLVRFERISYAEVSVATGTGLFEGLGSVTIYFDCKSSGPHTVCSDWVEWRPPSGFYRRHSVVEAVNVFRSRVLPYAFGLIARSGVVVGAPVEKFRAAVHGLARRLYLALRPEPSNPSSNCRAPSVEPSGDGGFSVCFKCPPTLWRRLLNTSRVSGHHWNDIIVEVLSGVLP
jgi:hypothetical protein